MNFIIPSEVKYIIDTLYKNDFEAFIVGGCVRDFLLSINPKDFDITTSANPEQILKLFDKTVPTGLAHGTVTVVLNKENFEVTTYRKDGEYLDNRKPSSVEFVSNIKEDLSRRDFTVNALAFNDKNGIIDYFNGISDLNNKILRAVGDADTRFKEDALRMLRAIRFSAQLDFDIEPNTLKAIIDNKDLINNISKERIRDELCKILISNNPSKGLTLLKDTGLLSIILPDINNLSDFSKVFPESHHNFDVFIHTLKVVENIDNNLNLRLAALFHDVGKFTTLKKFENNLYGFPNHHIIGSEMVKPILRNLRFENKTINSVSKLIKHHLVLDVHNYPSKYEVKKLIIDIGIENIFNIFALQRADIKSLNSPSNLFFNKIDFIENTVKDILNNKEPLFIKDLLITGNDLISQFNIKGKVIGDILDYILDEVLKDESLNSKDKLLTLASSYIKEKNLYK